ncbi:MAG: methyl-accepting chemotaxis protein [Planctomycetes bacterium]|nr:methyl-accepting chemotaxis protein [Planctomycetota bacterium]
MDGISRPGPRAARDAPPPFLRSPFGVGEKLFLFTAGLLILVVAPIVAFSIRALDAVDRSAETEIRRIALTALVEKGIALAHMIAGGIDAGEGPALARRAEREPDVAYVEVTGDPGAPPVYRSAGEIAAAVPEAVVEARREIDPTAPYAVSPPFGDDRLLEVVVPIRGRGGQVRIGLERTPVLPEGGRNVSPRAGRSRAFALIWIAGASVLAASAGGFLYAWRLRRAARRLLDRVAEIARGRSDLTQRIRMDGRDELGELAYLLNAFLDRLCALLARVGSLTELVVDSTRRIADRNGAILEGSRAQNRGTENVAGALQAMTESIRRTSEHVSVARRSTRAAARRATEGGRTLVHSIEAMEEAMVRVEESGEAIARLARYSEEVGQVIRMISHITAQTQLLALNAGIEAARAGDAGIGFAAVAEEVRRLAENTKAATARMRETLESIQCAAEGASASMDSARRQVRDRRSSFEGAGDSLRSILEDSDRTVETLAAIEATIEEQSRASTAIATSVDDIADATRHGERDVEELARVNEGMRERVSHLRRTVAAFRI